MSGEIIFQDPLQQQQQQQQQQQHQYS
jgi:hypothetical protein